MEHLELKIYELLGVKKFKKIVFWVSENANYLFSKKSREEYKKHFYIHDDNCSNYTLKKGFDLQNIRDFKKHLRFNAAVHIYASFFPFLSICTQNLNPYLLGVSIFMLLVQSYCVMLQRYNHIRINQALKRFEPYEEKIKETLKEELKKTDSLLHEHTYKVESEKEITLDELIESASLSELRGYRDYIEECRVYDEEYRRRVCYEVENYSCRRLSITGNKTLKLEFKNTYNNRSANE